MEKQGRLIVIEGLDGSGKGTQTEILYKHLQETGKAVRRITFPDYANKSSTLVKMYLEGEIGGLHEVNSYAASSFYACDRYISYQRDWKQDYESGGVILCDRYTTSNIVYQMAKLPQGQWEEYRAWAHNYEFERLGLPEPDLVLYLDMHPDTSRALLQKRYSGDSSKMDIHEQDLQFLQACRAAALYAAEKMNWRILRCCRDGTPLPVAEIAGLIQKETQNIFEE